MSAKSVRVEYPAAGISHVVLQMPEQRNPIDHAVIDALDEAIAAGGAAVVVSAEPGPAFSAGGDLRLGTGELQRLSDRIYALCRRLADSATVLLAAADGEAVGGGAQLLLAADLRVAGPRLRFRPSLPERGLAAGMWLLPATVGRGRALDLLLTGRALDASEALVWGVVDRLADDATAAALELAVHVAEIPLRHRARVKRGVAEGMSWGALAYEQTTFRPPSDASEGLE
jgi:enoyl-CoA hydratase/carnithine racemase